MTSMLLTERMAPACAAEVFSLCAAIAMRTPKKTLPAPMRGERTFKLRALVARLGTFRPTGIGGRIVFGCRIDQGLHFGLERFDPIRALAPLGAVPFGHISGVVAVMVRA